MLPPADSLFGGLPAPRGEKRTQERDDENNRNDDYTFVFKEEREDEDDCEVRAHEKSDQQANACEVVANGEAKRGAAFDDDLDGFNDGVAKKRQRAHKESETNTKEVVADVNLKDYILRLAALLPQSSKFRKAAALAHKLVASGQINCREIAIDFISMLGEMMQQQSSITDRDERQHANNDVRAELLRETYSSLMPMLQKLEPSWQNAHTLKLRCWYISATLQYDILKTDDSFVFNNILSSLCKELTELENALSASVSPVSRDVATMSWELINCNDTEDDGKNIGGMMFEGIIRCAEAAHSRYHISWVQGGTDRLTQHLVNLTTSKQLTRWQDRLNAINQNVQQRKRNGGIFSNRKTGLELTSFEREQAKAASTKMSIRKAVGGNADRKAAQWLG